MTSVGKLLVVLQLVLSLSFVVFAGAVYTTHKTWRQKAEQAEATSEKARTDMNAALTELNTKQAEATAAVDAAGNQVAQLEGQLRNAESALNAEKQKNNRLEQELLTQTGLAEAKASEASYRLEQATVQSAMNSTLHEKLEETSTKARSLKDKVFATSLALEQTEGRYSEALSELADMRTVLSATGISTDLETIRTKDEPPPPIDGLVTNTRRDNTGNVVYIAMSIGSDDGLMKGHELSVIRPAERNQGRAKFLGTVEIVKLTNDAAVGRVVERTKSGIIEEGDNVTSKL